MKHENRPENAHPPAGSEQTLRRFYDTASVMMGTIEITEDDIVPVSDDQIMARAFGTNSEAMWGRTASSPGVPGRYLPMWLNACHASVHSDGPVCFDYEHEGMGWLKVTVNYSGRSSGRDRCLYVVDNVNELKRAEAALQEANARLETRVAERTAELSAANARLRHDAFHDALTDLPNRLLFTDRLEHALQRYRRDPDRGFAVLFIGLNHFKIINDSLGHEAGDALLIAVGERLSRSVREGDTVARFGGDEFTLLLEACDAARAAEVAARVREGLAQPFNVGGRNFTLSGSVGMVVAQAEHGEPQDLLRDADLAMYQAKRGRSGRVEVFDLTMREAAVRRLEFESDLQAALGGGQLEVHFQPIVQLERGTLTGFEALARWPHPKHGLLMPEVFIPLAEESNLVVELDRFVLQRACRQLSCWRAQLPDHHELSVSVNLSGRGFLHEDIVRAVERALDEHDLAARHLNLEITESHLMQPTAAVDEVVARLAALGVGLCLDDFGTGYASLAYLQRLPASGLKIDRSFIREVDESDKSRILVGGVAAMARALGMRVVAEGVETHVQAARVRELGCDHAQGYLFARPLTAEQADGFLLAHGG